MKNTKASSLSPSQPKATWKDVEANDAMIKSLCQRKCGNEWEDVAQNVRIRLWEKLDTFRGESTLATWIYRITLNECYALSRRQNTKKRASAVSIEDLEFVSNSPSPLRIVTAKHEIEKLQATQRTRRFLNRIQLVVDGYERQEVAAMQGITVTAAKTRIHHAAKALRRALAG